MKKTFSLMLGLLVFAGLVSLSSCSNDDDEKPAPTISISSTSLAAGGATSADWFVGEADPRFTVSLRAESGIKEFRVFAKINGGGESQVGSTVTSFSGNTVDQSVNNNFSLNDAATTRVEIRFEITDRDDRRASSPTFTINKRTLAAERTLSLFAQSAQPGDASGSETIGGFLVSTTGVVTNAAGATASTDITYAASATSGILVSPTGRTTLGISGVANSTGQGCAFATTSLDYATVTGRQIADAAAPTAANINIAANGTYIFRNAAGVRGIIKVNTISGTSGIYARANISYKILN